MASNSRVRLNEDLISSLPDGILCHILSFLTTKDSVCTRILSTRWTHLFKFVPMLDFEFPSHSSYPGSPLSSASCFVEFVNSVFILYNVSRMERFRLYSHNTRPLPGDSEYPILSWISSAIYRQVEQIDISLTHGGPWTLPRDLFSCKNLGDLTLYGNFEIVLPSSVSLPCLKTCNLSYVRLSEEKSRRLFQGCPVIERLRLYSCNMEDSVLNISSPTLKRFFIQVDEDQFHLVLNLPNLVHFEYVAEDSSSNEFLGLVTLKSLVEAIIHYEKDTNITDSVSIQLVQGICHVQQLCLYSGPMEAFLRSDHPWPIFNNLTRLIFGPMSNLSSKLLSGLLDNSPRLEFLSFNQSHRYGYKLDGADQDNYVLPGHVPTCVSLQLKEVEFRSFSMLEYECKLIRYFLKNAKNLKKMHIRPNKRWDKQLEIGSAECQIVFDSDGIEEQ